MTHDALLSVFEQAKAAEVRARDTASKIRAARPVSSVDTSAKK